MYTFKGKAMIFIREMSYLISNHNFIELLSQTNLLAIAKGIPFTSFSPKLFLSLFGLNTYYAQHLFNTTTNLKT